MSKYQVQIDDEEREMWVMNDESLYDAMMADDVDDNDEQEVADWIRNNREMIDEVASGVMSNAVRWDHWPGEEWE